MATWTTIGDTFLEPGKPVRSVDGLALRDNPIAIAEGAAGAPRVEDPALNTTATNTGRDWVLARTALSGLGAVGTYAMLTRSDNESSSPGATLSGSTLKYAGAATDILIEPSANLNSDSVSGASPAGTWRCMGLNAARDSFSGASGDSYDIQYATLWLRIA